MAAKKKAMRKTKGGAQVDYFLNLKGVHGEATGFQPTTTINFTGLE